MRILNIAFYHFLNLTRLTAFKALLSDQCKTLGLRGSILLSAEGVNGCLAGPELQMRVFQNFFKNQLVGRNLVYKESYSDTIPFRKMLIKIKKELIPLGDPRIKPAEQTAARISAVELKKWLDEDRDFVFLDTRNQYEIEFGTFKKAHHLGIRHFRSLPDQLNSLPVELREKTMVMFCTGGIRCEKASIAAMNMGFKSVFQLDGGILKYFEECGGDHYRGDCFVFDERVALSCDLKPKQGITNQALAEGRRQLNED